MALQMSWQPSLLLHRRKNAPPLGLKNLGNTCYLNSVLQCLTYTPPLANFCLKNQHSSLCDSSEADRKRDCPFCILEKRIVRSLSIDVPLDAPSKIQSCLSIFAEHFRLGRQEDAHEFLRYVIDACHNTCLRLKKLQQKQQQFRKGTESCNGGSGGSGETIVKEIFGGALQSQVKCLSCGNESNKIDDIMDISLDLSQSNSLKEAMQRFFQPEILDGSNKYKCDKCKKLVTARKQMSILKAPNILVIQLKDLQPEYNLFGTIVHSGYSPESGHYYAYIKDAMGRWYCCNDSHVSVSTLQEVLSEKVYILFFARANQRTRPSKTAPTSNGVKSPNCSTVPSPKTSLPLTTVPSKPSAVRSFDKDASTVSKIGKVPPNPRVSFNISRNPDPKRAYANGNGHLDAHKNGTADKHENLKESFGTDKRKKEVLPTNGTGSSENVSAHSENGTLILPNGNGEVQHIGVNSVKVEVSEDNGIQKTAAATGSAPDRNHTFHNEGDKHPSNILGLKRKSLEICPLLAHDASSQIKLEKFKEVLAENARSGLQSCGWYSKVHNYMIAKKKQCTREVGNTSSNIQIKERLISDAKSVFIPQIPESLKEHLVESLRSFSQGK
uniref:Ubiquitin carboxyl-terminal hydrolase n=1 Tax=Nelumbo nucifera TaxID=4432 RepID=A0A822Z1I5_NELNU|nr:TPA_asm: hypothetical protein HUJ06_007990 [Nelumbo nucifera]